MSSRPVPNPGIMDIAPYVGGKSKVAGGVVPIKLSSNETPLGASPRAVEAYQAASAALHRYPDGSATALREAIGVRFGLDASRIVCGAGSDELIALLVHAYCAKGDEVLMSAHGFLMYKIYAQGFGCTVVQAPETNLRADVDALLSRVTARTKILFLANPNNPTGTYLSGAELARLHAALPPHVILAIDGAYAEYGDTPDYQDGIALASTHENVVMLRTFSKVFGLSALRLGWAFGPPAIIDVMNRVRGPFNVSAPAIAAGVAAVQDVSFTNETLAHNKEWRDWLEAELEALGLTVVPSLANFLLVKFRDAAQAEAANQALLAEAIIVRDVKAYGLPDYLRISIGLEPELRALVSVLKRFLAAS